MTFGAMQLPHMGITCILHQQSLHLVCHVACYCRNTEVSPYLDIIGFHLGGFVCCETDVTGAKQISLRHQEEETVSVLKKK